VATFSLLVADCENTLEVVARFLALLELYREGLVEFEQPVSLDELTVRWVGGDDAGGELDIDDYEGTKPAPDAEGTTGSDESTTAGLDSGHADSDLGVGDVPAGRPSVVEETA
jgi:segregation and condensation protein A